MANVVYKDFEWDSDKAASNASKHGVSFEEASTVFGDLDYLLEPDASRSDRFLAVGFSALARILVVVHLEPGERIRIISARRATHMETQTYERRRSGA